MKRLFKKTKVVYDAHLDEYQVYYKNFLFWNLHRSYVVTQYLRDDAAKAAAVELAKNMLDTVEVYRS